MDPSDDWLMDLMNAPDPQRNRLQVVLITDDDEQDVTTMSSHSSEENDASTSVCQTFQQPVSRAITTLSKRPPGQLTPRGACYQTLVTVEVGSGKKKFVIHKDLLTFYSDYFRGAFNGSFKEAAEGKLSLLDEDVEVFDIFHKFLYTGSIGDGQGHNLRSDTLIKVWVFGDRFLIPCLQNSAIDALDTRLHIRHTIPTLSIKLIWENTLPNAPLRKYVLDVVVYTGDMIDILSPDHEQQWPREALLDLARALSSKAVIEQTLDSELCSMPKRPKCYYHVHAEGEKCE
ncbi:hypothetical protein KCU65_g4458, partial [Aureobasidium melanogenum]